MSLAEMPPLRQAGRGDDCSGALADAATTENMVLAEQCSEAALPQAVPGPSSAREAAAAAQMPFEPDVHGQGDERRHLPARSRDLQDLDPDKRPRLDPSEDDTPPHFEDTGTILGTLASRMEQLTEAAVCASARRSSSPAMLQFLPPNPRCRRSSRRRRTSWRASLSLPPSTSSSSAASWRGRRRRATSRRTSSASSCCRARPCDWARACGGLR